MNCAQRMTPKFWCALRAMQLRFALVKLQFCEMVNQ